MANIKLNNNEYPIPDFALAAPMAGFVAHLGTIAGSGLKVVIGGVEYGVDATKVAGAIAGLEGVLIDLQNNSSSESIAPGLYQTGAIALYNEQGASAVEGMMITPWDELITDDIIHVEDGVVFTNFDTYEWVNTSSEALTGDLILPDDGSIVELGNMYTDEETGDWLGNAAFTYCEYITGVKIPNSVTSICENAFDGCYLLQSIKIPSSVKSFNSYGTFNCCKQLTTVIFEEGSKLNSIGPSMFYGCEALESFDIPDSVTYIGDSAFSVCPALTSLEIPNGVTEIGYYAFMGCSSLTSITIPASVLEMGYAALAICDKLESITVASGNERYHSDGNCLIETADKVLCAGCKNSIIPTDGSVTSIGDEAFRGSSIASIIIPDGVTSVGSWTFIECASLTSVELPASIVSIGEEAFWECTSLTSITFNGTVAQFEAVTKGEAWNDRIPAIYVQCTDGTFGFK